MTERERMSERKRAKYRERKRNTYSEKKAEERKRLRKTDIETQPDTHKDTDNAS